MQTIVATEVGATFRDSRIRVRLPLTSTTRGKISEFSRQSRNRMIRWMITKHVDGAQTWAATLTHSHPTTAPAAEDVTKFVGLWGTLLRFATVQRIPMIWRAEPHANGYPHIHAIIWHGLCAAAIADEWRRLCNTTAEICAHIRTSDDPRWMVYITLDTGKRSRGTSIPGWTGTYWGITCRKAFVDLPKTSWDVPDDQVRDVLRMLRCVMWLRGMRSAIPFGAWARIGISQLLIDDIVCRVKLRHASRPTTAMHTFKGE